MTRADVGAPAVVVVPSRKDSGYGRYSRTRSRREGIRAGIRDAGPLAAAGFFANGLNVLVTLVVARLLTTRGYGALAQITSVFLVVSIPGTAVVVGVVRRVTALNSNGHGHSVASWATRVHRLATGAICAIVVVAAVASESLARGLSIPSALGVFAAITAGAVWVLLSVDRGLLQAGQAYHPLSINLVVEGAVRTAVVLCLVGAGFGVTGAAFGLLVAEIVTLLHARVAADGRWLADTEPALPHNEIAHDPVAQGPVAQGPVAQGLVARDAIAAPAPVVVASGCDGSHESKTGLFGRGRHRLLLDVAAALVALALLAYLQNVDIIILSRQAPHASGPYAAISVATKALVFAALALGGYLMPEAAIEWQRGDHALRQLSVTLLVLAVPGTALLIFAAAFPERVLSVVFSPRYSTAHSAFAVLALAMVFLSVSVVLTLYLLAAGQRWVGGLLLTGAVAATVALAAAHGAPRPTAVTDLAVQATLLAAIVASFVLVHARHRRRVLAARAAV